MADSATHIGLGPDDMAYIEQVRAATRRLASADLRPDDVRGALGAVHDIGDFDVDAPTASARREVRAAKVAVKRAVAWYLRYLAHQANDFAHAVLRLGDATAARLETVENRLGELAVSDAELRAHHQQLVDRVSVLEERLGRVVPAPDRPGPGAR